VRYVTHPVPDTNKIVADIDELVLTVVLAKTPASNGYAVLRGSLRISQRYFVLSDSMYISTLRIIQLLNYAVGTST
jgi:hypothetical protein